MSNIDSHKSSVYQYQQIDIVKNISEYVDEDLDIKEVSFNYFDSNENQISKICFIGRKQTDLWWHALKFIHRLKYIK